MRRQEPSKDLVNVWIFFGISLLAIVTAVGGGILRDSIISRFPSALADPGPIYVSILVAVIMYAFVTSKQANASQEKNL